MKSNFPIQTAEYAVQNKLVSEPAFAWWVPTVLKERDRIVSKVKVYWKRTHKFGFQLPKSVKEALDIDAETGTSHWVDAIAKEMKNASVAFKILEEGDEVPIGTQKITCHMVFDIKFDFTRKARFVAGGHLTETPASLTYSSVVSRESVRIALLIAALNDLQVLSADIGNAYLNAPAREKTYFIAGSEFGKEHAGKRVLIVCALYGLKSSGAAWRSHLAQTLVDMEFISCHGADPDVWRRPAVKHNGTKYYDCLLYTSPSPRDS